MQDLTPFTGITGLTMLVTAIAWGIHNQDSTKKDWTLKDGDAVPIIFIVALGLFIGYFFFKII